jgi:hypothetical protein
MQHRLAGMAFMVAFASSACGAAATSGGASRAGNATPPSSSDPKSALLTAVRATTGTSFRADLTLRISFTATGPAAANLDSLNGVVQTLTVHVDQENKQRSRAEVSTIVAGHAINAIAVVYDGTVYTSLDGGQTYSTAATGKLPSSYSVDSALQYLNSVGTVSDSGAGEMDGVQVETYHAELDPAKVTALIKTALSGTASAVVSKVLGHIRFTGGHIDASLDSNERLISDSGVINASIDMGSLERSLQGTSLAMEEDISGDFHDYGATITVTAPQATTGV